MHTFFLCSFDKTKQFVHSALLSSQTETMATPAACRAVSGAVTPTATTPRAWPACADERLSAFGGARNLFALPLGEDHQDQTCSCSRILKA